MVLENFFPFARNSIFTIAPKIFNYILATTIIFFCLFVYFFKETIYWNKFSDISFFFCFTNFLIIIHICKTPNFLFKKKIAITFKNNTFALHKHFLPSCILDHRTNTDFSLKKKYLFIFFLVFLKVTSKKIIKYKYYIYYSREIL
jgi:hypothetical protein